MNLKLRPESDQADVQAFVQQLILTGKLEHRGLELDGAIGDFAEPL